MDFFELLKLSIGSIQQSSMLQSESDWAALHETAKRQALIGVIFSGIKKLPENMRPSKQLLLQWFMEAERIRKLNEKYNATAVNVTTMFDQAGIDNCILKGQGNALMYDDPFVRIPGDIDIWINPSKVVVSDGKLLVGDRQLPVEKISYRHIEVGRFEGIELEVHLRPSFMNNLIVNSRLQRWFDEQAESQFRHSVEVEGSDGYIHVPTVEFNLVYQLCHITNHFFYEGIGLRQFVDYYYLLKKARQTGADKDRVLHLIKVLGLLRMARAVMYVEQHLLGLDDCSLLVPAEARRGEFLVNEIMLSGNFGQYDERVKVFSRRTAFGRNIERLRRDFRLMWLFPSESLWEPVFRLYHYLWRVKNG